MISDTKQLGIVGEQYVADYLVKQGFAVCARNFSTRDGEIDLIAQKDSLILFVEVKTRINPLFDMAQVITPSKQHKIVRTARKYLILQNLDQHYCRFDVALVQKIGDRLELEYIQDAFGPME